MGCFLGCFGVSKDDKKRHKITHIPHHNPNFGKQYSPVNQNVAAKQVLVEEPINSSITELRVKPEEEKSSSTINFRDEQEEQFSIRARKRVTFDSNDKEYEHVSCNEPPETLEDDEKEIDFTSERGSMLSSLGTFPPNHRYQNCTDGYDEDDELGCEVSDLDDDDEDDIDEDDDEEAYDAEYSDDEYYSRRVSEISTRSSIESETKSSLTYAANDRHDDESQKGHYETLPQFQRGARDRAAYVNSVLNPVENTAQWKHLKAKRTSSLHQQKENVLRSKTTQNCPETNFGVAVDASLSTWLSSSTKTPPTKAMHTVLEPISSSASMVSSHGSNTVILREERPILGALAVEELKQISASSSPR